MQQLTLPVGNLSADVASGREQALSCCKAWRIINDGSNGAASVGSSMLTCFKPHAL